MTWEILCGLITILSSMIAVGTVLVKLIRTLATLESAVRELKDFITRQTGKNDYFFKEIARIDREIAALEAQLGGGGRST
ncbi:MAG: hypothetical protein SPJ23_09275 [Eubacteriales bacterium]|nr:hypothetical protein [Eubacteriales bacterium]